MHVSLCKIDVAEQRVTVSLWRVSENTCQMLASSVASSVSTMGTLLAIAVNNEYTCLTPGCCRHLSMCCNASVFQHAAMQVSLGSADYGMGALAAWQFCGQLT